VTGGVLVEATEQTTRSCEATVIIPTRNESDNVDALLARLDAALQGIDAEVLFVDDSDDDTPARIRAAGATARHPVRLLHRLPGERAGGLGSAVLQGIAHSEATWVVVMDGDLQHPPEVVPELLMSGWYKGADVVVASRYTGAGDASGLSSAGRNWVSRGSTMLARASFPRRLHACTDPMSGFFAVRRASLDLGRLRPNGFKILLEILARSGRLRVVEHPFTFAARHAGDSKASWREGIIYLRRLAALRAVTLLPGGSSTLVRATAFAAVGASGIVVNSVALWALVRVLNLPLAVAAILATQFSTAWNFALIDGGIYRGAKARGFATRFIGFAAINNALLLVRIPLLALLVDRAHIHFLIANILTLLAVFVGRFVLSDRVLFTREEPMTLLSGRRTPLPREDRAPAGDSRQRIGPVDLVVDLTSAPIPPVSRLRSAPLHHYSVHDIVTISSAVRLPELEYFRLKDGPLPGRADIEIVRGRIGSSHLRARSRVTQYANNPAVCYQEHLGRIGCDFLVDMSDGVKITVGPLLASSPHVLYTNVVEALLRFLLVSRGYVLLHSACLDFNGRGVLLSALTDTGKTGTVLRLLREHGGRFLSDDMTVLDASGRAHCYPKPLTISQHTLRAVNAGDLTRQEWRRLRVQSRIHSKEGRNVGARLGAINLPIMSLNATTQYIVPPPKYVVQRLVPCENSTTVEVDSLFIIERNESRVEDVAADQLIDELIANTDDAYGFPPFRYFAPALVIDGLGYDELRARERALLASAMASIRARRLASPNFGWAEQIHRLLQESADAADESIEEVVDVRRAPTASD
jgi:glycosyltransferase involved in cell wall biosynthesis